jgi:hypothetical protein
VQNPAGFNPQHQGEKKEPELQEKLYIYIYIYIYIRIPIALQVMCGRTCLLYQLLGRQRREDCSLRPAWTRDYLKTKQKLKVKGLEAWLA